MGPMATPGRRTAAQVVLGRKRPIRRPRASASTAMRIGTAWTNASPMPNTARVAETPTSCRMVGDFMVLELRMASLCGLTLFGPANAEYALQRKQFPHYASQPNSATLRAGGGGNA